MDFIMISRLYYIFYSYLHICNWKIEQLEILDDFGLEIVKQLCVAWSNGRNSTVPLKQSVAMFNINSKLFFGHLEGPNAAIASASALEMRPLNKQICP